MMAPPSSSARIVRDAEFARRLDQACDSFAQVPSGHGRLTWVQRELENRMDLSVSLETVRKWFAGEAKPRQEKLPKIAEMLQVDVAWLSLGVDPDMQIRGRPMRNPLADGPARIVAGLIQMDGGQVTFPEETDKEAQKNHVHLRAIIKGAKYDLHASPGKVDGRKVKFSVPANSGAVIVLGLIRQGFAIEIVEITPELIAAGTRRDGSIEVLIDPHKSKLRKIESFRNRL